MLEQKKKTEMEIFASKLPSLRFSDGSNSFFPLSIQFHKEDDEAWGEWQRRSRAENWKMMAIWGEDDDDDDDDQDIEVNEKKDDLLDRLK